VIKNKPVLPEKSGIYLFKSKNQVLYIGKAKNLQKRIEQYFQKNENLVINNLLHRAQKVDYIITDNEADALHLEYNLIHQYHPPFNIRLKDDKSYPYIEISIIENFPCIFYSRDVKSKSFSVGPIPDSRKARNVIDVITRLFKLRSCTNQIFKQSSLCLYYYIDHCSGPCEKKISQEKYKKHVADAISLLKGKKRHIIQKMTKQMGQYADKLEFEMAQKLKEDIDLIKSFSFDTYISSIQKIDYDVIVSYAKPDSAFLILFSVIKGKIKKKDFFSFDTLRSNPGAVMKDFLISHYNQNNLPDQIILSTLPDDLIFIQDIFSKLRGKIIPIRQTLADPIKSQAISQYY